jgi:hypothetical protein
MNGERKSSVCVHVYVFISNEILLSYKNEILSFLTTCMDEQREREREKA